MSNIDDFIILQFEVALEFLMAATFPLDDLQGGEGQPCLMVQCQTQSLAVKLLQHTMSTLGEFEIETTVYRLVEQKIGDSLVSDATSINLCSWIEVVVYSEVYVILGHHTCTFFTWVSWLKWLF